MDTSLKIAQLEAEIEWLKARPDMAGCDWKCGYGKTGDINGCWCGMAQWELGKPEHLKQKDAELAK